MLRFLCLEDGHIIYTVEMDNEFVEWLNNKERIAEDTTNENMIKVYREILK